MLTPEIEKKIEALRASVTSRLGEFRANHVLSTEGEAARIAAVYLPDDEEKVRISALLHDITKEYTKEQQLAVFTDFGVEVDAVMRMSPKVFHAHTAALLIPREYPEFADPAVLSAVDKHTTGSADMSLMDCIIYLADYIEPTRKFEDCKKLRAYFWDGIHAGNTEAENLTHLYRTMVLSFDLTMGNLIDEGCVIAPETVAARNAFLVKLAVGGTEEKNGNGTEQS